MFFLRRPPDDRILRILDEQSRQPFSYPEIGATRVRAPEGYPLNHHRARVGTGEAQFRRAVAAIRAWSMYDMPWTVIYPSSPPIRPGTTVGVLVWHFGFWSLNPCRILYRLEEGGAVERFGFAFGTLPEHSERGEERFTVEWHRADDSVWYEIYTFAEGRHPLVRAAHPLLILMQRFFGRASIRAMTRAVRGDAE
jgi:uncharacterized protein (UPF0548 family)